MFNNVIKSSFAVVGAVTGFTLSRTFLSIQNIELSLNMQIIIYFFAAFVLAFIFYISGSKLIEMVVELLDEVEAFMHKLTLYEILISSLGLIIGLVVANLVTIPANKIAVIGMPISIIANILFGFLGMSIAAGKKNETLFDAIKEKKFPNHHGNRISAEPKLLDTSIIIDGRIVDICRYGFMEGEFIVPSFILEELRHIADSQDTLKRSKGRRGLDVLNMLQKDINYPMRIENIEIADAVDVDDKLLIAAKKLGCKVITIDYNLSKVASFQGVQVLNINELANAMKPIALPGEEMTVQVIKDGKESGQGIGYLEDGTMIVVEGGRRHIGEAVIVMVTSVLQTAAGRMIFAKPKYQIERVV